MAIYERKVVAEIWKLVKLPVNDEFLNLLPEKLDNRNFKYKTNINQKNIDIMTRIMKGNLVELGYEI